MRRYRVCSGRHYTPKEQWTLTAERWLLAGYSVNQVARKVGLTNGNGIQEWIRTDRLDLLPIALENGLRAKARVKI